MTRLQLAVQARPWADTAYDRTGPRYSRVRRPDPLAVMIADAAGDARVVVNVGAGACSMSHRDRLDTSGRRPMLSHRHDQPPFGATAVVDHVDFVVPSGSAFGCLGPNGAGKTTLMRTLLGLTRASDGTMALLGHPVPAQRRQALARVGAIVDGPRFHRHPRGDPAARSRAWLELDIGIGFLAGLGLGSLAGQRMVPAILLIVLQIIITPVLASHVIPYFLDGQRLVVGVAIDQLRPAALWSGVSGGLIRPGGSGALQIPPMPTWAMVSVIAGWAVGWTGLGAWRMMTTDA